MIKVLQYFVPHSGSIHTYCWDNQCVVYQVESGDTHLLSKLDLAVLQCINDQPISVADLLAKTEHLFDGDAGQYIDALVINFQQLCLVDVVNKAPSN